MQYRKNSREAARFLLTDATLRRALYTAARRKLPRMKALMPKDTGHTAATGRVEMMNRAGGKRDRMGARIAFDGTAVVAQFGNKRRRATRPMTRAMVER